ncbi:MAG: sugar ABC transporter permease, partial [Kiloniellaceae bacterium]|nr:sugar ABC transporter permease [Kiloniellaceae bacterium]
MTTLSTDAVAGGKSHVSIGDYLKTHVRDYGMLVALVVIMAFFQIWTNGVLMKPLNLTNLVLQNSYIIIMALGMLLVIVCGHIDLSVGSVVGLIGALAAVMIVNYQVPVIVAVPACLVVGALIGAGAALGGALLAGAQARELPYTVLLVLAIAMTGLMLGGRAAAWSWFAG